MDPLSAVGAEAGMPPGRDYLLSLIDSVAALVPRVELEGEMGDTHVGLQARLMSKAMRKLAGVVSKTKDISDIYKSTT